MIFYKKQWDVAREMKDTCLFAVLRQNKLYMSSQREIVDFDGPSAVVRYDNIIIYLFLENRRLCTTRLPAASSELYSDIKTRIMRSLYSIEYRAYD